ncbi:HAD family phosphatase [Clostridium tyrobutyricum]|uniref:HAD family hydrolase n=1 Tax=Clostridium tyrobutyricum TaxID=1519 RepID=UPI001C38C4DD|nr:HAD family phosphatase [Clostridium tyrobutyricum]MBV4419760.1 HAD family phosphatase [Clostridium tyrobutyricum]
MDTSKERKFIDLFKNINGAIFDLDGTLINSMGIWDDIDREYLWKRGLSIPKNLKYDIESLNFTEAAKYFQDKFSLSDSIDVIQNDWYDMAFYKYSNSIMLKPYALEFLKLLKSKDIKIALATSNYRTLAEATLKKNNIYELFDVITTTEDVKHGKNFPDIYIMASKKIKVIPRKCVVFEDSLNAIKTVKLSNMKIIAVKDAYCPHNWNTLLQYSDLGITNFSELIGIFYKYINII